MTAFFKYLSIAYCALLWALASCYISFFNFAEWGEVVAGVTFVAVAVFLVIYKRNDERGVGWQGTVFSLMVLISCAAIAGGLTKYALIIPAEVLHISAPEIVVDVVMILAIPILIYEFLFPEEPEPQGAHSKTEEQVATTYSRHVRWASCAIMFALILVCSLVPATRERMTEFFTMLGRLDIMGICETIRSYGAWGAAVSALLMVLQALAAPIPAYLLTISNAMVYGWAAGALLSWSSAMLAAAICFWIARMLGRDFIMRFVTSGVLARIDKFFEHYGKNAVLILRLMPFMSFDYVSYAAGLTGMSFVDFLIATGVGQLPATILYSVMADLFVGSSFYLVYGLCALFAVAALIWLIREVYTARHKDLMSDDAEGAESAKKEAAEATSENSEK